jgi:hypothetical protein
MIDQVFRTPEKRCIGQDFFERFPQYLKYNLSNPRLTADFLDKISNHPSEVKIDYFGYFKSVDSLSGFFLPRLPSRFIGNRIPNRYTIFENTGIGAKFLETLLMENKEKIDEELIQVLNANHSLSESFWERYPSWIYWGTEERFQNPSKIFKSLKQGNDGKGVSEFVFLEYMETNISCNPNLSIQFIKKYKDKLNLAHVFKYNNELPNYFFRQAMVNFLGKTRKSLIKKQSLEKFEKEEKIPLTFVQKLKKFKTETIKVWEKLNTVNISHTCQIVVQRKK